MSEKGIDQGFFGHHIYSADNIAGVDYDAVLVSSIDEKIVADILQAGVPPQKIYYLLEAPGGNG